jgi:subfamily B ATP-binding cassette protein MsbA
MPINSLWDLPEQYGTKVGERGFNLSGGEKQRIAIARAVLANPQLLILDEAFSSLDTESEHSVSAALTRLSEERVTFIVTHRLSMISHADLILVMDQGRIIERGSHEQLLKVDGTYCDLLHRQSRREADNGAEDLFEAPLGASLA